MPTWSSTTSWAVDRLFKPPHFEKYPHLHDLFDEATNAGQRGRQRELGGPGRGPEALDLIGEIDAVFWEPQKAA